MMDMIAKHGPGLGIAPLCRALDLPRGERQKCRKFHHVHGTYGIPKTGF